MILAYAISCHNIGRHRFHMLCYDEILIWTSNYVTIFIDTHAKISSLISFTFVRYCHLVVRDRIVVIWVISLIILTKLWVRKLHMQQLHNLKNTHTTLLVYVSQNHYNYYEIQLILFIIYNNYYRILIQRCMSQLQPTT